MIRAWSLTFRRILGRLAGRRPDRSTVQELSRSLALIVDREALDASVGARIRELLDPDRLIILKPDAATATFRPSFSFGIEAEALAAVQIAFRGKLTRWLSANETCLILQRHPGVQEYLDPAERELLERLRLTTCVPMISLNRLTGILFLGADHPGWVPSRSQAELLDLLAAQASLAFENAALYHAERDRLDRLHRAERLAAVGQLAAGVAHEIRNPLTAIRSTMQYLLRGLDPDEPRSQLVSELLSEVDRINSTVGGLLSLSQGAGHRREEVDLRATLAGVVHLLQAQAAEQGVEIHSDLAAGAPVVLGDAGQLRQVFLNLLLNALQATPHGGSIEVRLVPWQPWQSSARRGWVEIRIADTGPGIPAHHLRKVFDPFFTTKREGTGLGLAICHGIVEQHEGEIHLHTGKGTTALVRLPLREGDVWRAS